MKKLIDKFKWNKTYKFLKKSNPENLVAIINASLEQLHIKTTKKNGNIDNYLKSNGYCLDFEMYKD